MTFKTILVALDGSKHAGATAEAAAELARHCEAKLLILHVVAPIFDGKVRDELGNLARMEHREQTEYEMLQGFGRDIVHAAELKARQSGVRQIEALVEVGDPASLIVDMARARGADLIVLGRRGLGPLAGLLLGSVSHKVIQVADRPCLTVPS
ncbi:MAG TPA: universal stress protein [Devosiaceae bacterium]|jgi:nucleotide-binding universal stress UspA family protein|nr:universal stress protein [Devosiaceae bacterium]